MRRLINHIITIDNKEGKKVCQNFIECWLKHLAYLKKQLKSTTWGHFKHPLFKENECHKREGSIIKVENYVFIKDR